MVQLEESIEKWCGLVAGYPAALGVVRQRLPMGIHVPVPLIRVHIPYSQPPYVKTPEAGVYLTRSLKLAPCIKKGPVPSFFSPTFNPWGFTDAFQKSWADVVRAGRPHFPGGKMEFTATMKLGAVEAEESEE